MTSCRFERNRVGTSFDTALVTPIRCKPQNSNISHVHLGFHLSITTSDIPSSPAYVQIATRVDGLRNLMASSYKYHRCQGQEIPPRSWRWRWAIKGLTSLGRDQVSLHGQRSKKLQGGHSRVRPIQGDGHTALMLSVCRPSQRPLRMLGVQGHSRVGLLKGGVPCCFVRLSLRLPLLDANAGAVRMSIDARSVSAV